MQNSNLSSWEAGSPTADDQGALWSAESYTEQPFPAY